MTSVLEVACLVLGLPGVRDRFLGSLLSGCLLPGRSDELQGELGVGMVWTVKTFAVGENLLVEGERTTEIAGELVGVGKVAARGDGLGMVRAEDAGVVGGGLLVQLDGAAQVA